MNVMYRNEILKVLVKVDFVKTLSEFFDLSQAPLTCVHVQG